MNEGVELLLKRRETNPEEFVEQLDRFEPSRWGRFLSAWSIDLNDPSTYIQAKEHGETFTKEVMDRLLTQSDLKPRGSGISRTQLLKELLPGLNELFRKEYEKESP